MALSAPCHAQQESGRTAAAQLYSLRGVVTDAATRLPLTGASVYFTDLKTGAVTGSDGSFYIKNLPGGFHTLEISYVGYATATQLLHITGELSIAAALQPSILESHEVIVTGVSVGLEIRRSPAPVSQIKRLDISRAVATNLVDLIAHKPGISQITTGPAISKPVIRGLGSNRVVVLNDGVRQEGQQWGDEHGLELDEYSVQKVELIKGPASLIYGSDALAGVLQVFTNLPVPQGTFRGMVTTQYQSNNRMRGAGFQFGAHRPDGFNWNLYSSVKAAADYENRYDGRVFNSKFSERNVGGYAGWNRAWGYSHLIFSSYNQKAGLIEGERNEAGQFLKLLPDGSEAVAGTEDFRMTRPQIPWQHIRHNRVVSDNSFNLGSGRLAVNLAWQGNNRREYGDATAPEVPELDFALSTLTYTAAYHLNTSRRWTASFGINGMSQTNRNLGEELLIPEYRLWDIGSFVYARKLMGKWTLSGGVRQDYRNLESFADEESASPKFESFRRQFSNVSASIGVSFIPSRNWVLKGNLARGFRAPSIAELASNGTHEGTNRYEYGVQQLRSETSLQTDIGVEWSSDHLMLGASFFYNSIQRFIFFNKLESSSGGDSLVEADGEWLMAFQFNQRNAALYGVEITADWHPHPLDWLHFENSLSWVRGRFLTPIEGNENIPFMPAARLQSNLRADLKTPVPWLKNTSLSLEGEHTFAQNRVFTTYDTETATPSYTLLHAGFSTDIHLRDKNVFSLHLAVRNLGDVAYQNHLSRLKYTVVNEATGRRGVFNMGRNFSIRLNIPIEGVLKTRPR